MNPQNINKYTLHISIIKKMHKTKIKKGCYSSIPKRSAVGLFRQLLVRASKGLIIVLLGLGSVSNGI